MVIGCLCGAAEGTFLLLINVVVAQWRLKLASSVAKCIEEKRVYLRRQVEVRVTTRYPIVLFNG